jgi:hypothetical protein
LDRPRADLRIDDESRYIDAALYLVTCNAQPYSRHDWHWRLLVAHTFGHAAAVPAVHGALKLLDDAGITGELAVREVRSGRVEVVQMWGRPESRAGSSGACARSDGARRRAHPRPPVRLQGPVGAAGRRPRGRPHRPARSRRGTRWVASTCSSSTSPPRRRRRRAVRDLATGGELHDVRSLGFFAHVQPEGATRAAAGFDQVVSALADGARGRAAGRRAAGRAVVERARARET